MSSTCPHFCSTSIGTSNDSSASSAAPSDKSKDSSSVTSSDPVSITPFTISDDSPLALSVCRDPAVAAEKSQGCASVPLCCKGLCCKGQWGAADLCCKKLPRDWMLMGACFVLCCISENGGSVKGVPSEGAWSRQYAVRQVYNSFMCCSLHYLFALQQSLQGCLKWILHGCLQCIKTALWVAVSLIHLCRASKVKNPFQN